MKQPYTINITITFKLNKKTFKVLKNFWAIETKLVPSLCNLNLKFFPT